MAIHTFSTVNKTEDDKLVKEIKDRCKAKRVSFSSIVIESLKEKYACLKTK